MTDTRKRWFKVGTVFGTVPDGVPSEKTENFQGSDWLKQWSHD